MTEITKIADISILDLIVPVYYDPYALNPNFIYCSWTARNPDSFYTGLIYRNSITGEISYPENAVIPVQTKRDMEMIPKFIILGTEEFGGSKDVNLHMYLMSEYKIRNTSRGRAVGSSLGS